MGDFFAFRRMVTPIIIQFLFWVFTVAVILTGLVRLIQGEGASQKGIGLAILVIGPVLVRIYAEILIIVFRINETLTEIKNNTERR